MACNLPLPAWQLTAELGGGVILGLKQPSSQAERLLLPCGKCRGCRTSQAREWALRCHLEMQYHKQAAFITLTYDDRWLPPTLVKRHLQAFFKRLRRELGPKRPIRYFASGEYGEHGQRPHYHAVVYGLSEADRKAVEKAWTTGKRRQRKGRVSLGRTATQAITPARIAYVAGYTQKKLSDAQHTRHERVDESTGEIYRWQPPFIEMSRVPGIGGEARKHTDSWREYAIHNGRKMAVPRFYHAAWKATATPEQIAELKRVKKEKAEQQKITLQMLSANEEIMVAKQALDEARRHTRL